MKKVTYALILPLVVVNGSVFANHEIKNETFKKSAEKPLSAAEKNAELKKWEATPDGIKFKKWEASPEGQKVLILRFGLENANEFRQLHSLKVNDKIIISSHSVFGVMYAPKYSYPIISGDYVERDGKIIYKRAPGKGGS